MTPRTLGTLVVLGIAAVAGGWYFGTATTPVEQTTVATDGLMFPDLAPKLQDVVKVDIIHQGKQLVIEKRADGDWGVASMHDYPVQETKLRGMLAGLTDLRLSELRTSDPAEYSRLGVGDPNDASSTADLLQLVDKAGKPVAAVIVGHRRVRSQGNVPDEVYVRRPGDNQSWLAQGNLVVDADASLWLDRDLMNIPHDRIASIVVGDKTLPSGRLTFGRVDGQFALIEPADHPKLESYKVDDVSRALEQLTFQTVKADADVPGTEAGQSVFTTSDGLVVTVTLRHPDPGGTPKDDAAKEVWVRFTVSGSDKAKADADKLNARLAGWTYQIGSWKEQSLLPTIADLKAEDLSKPGASGPSGAAPEAPPAAEPGGAPTAAPGVASSGAASSTAPVAPPAGGPPSPSGAPATPGSGGAAAK